MKWTIRKKLWTVAGIPLTGLVVATAVALWTNGLVTADLARTSRNTEQLLTLQKLKNAEFALALTGMEIIADRDQGSVAPPFRRELEKNVKAMRAGLEEAAALTATAEGQTLLETIRGETENFIRLSTESLPRLVEQQAAAGAFDRLDDQLDAAGQNITRDLDSAIGQVTQKQQKAAAQLQSQVQAADRTMAAVLAVVLSLILPTLVLMVRRIVGPLRRTLDMIQALESGHLTARLGLQQQDEVGQLGRAMDRLADSLQHEVIDNLQKLARGDLNLRVRPRNGEDQLRGALKLLSADLNGLMGQIQTTGERIATGASQVSDASQSLSQGATEQASSLEEISASLQEITSQVSQNAENAGQANRLSSSAQAAAENGNVRMTEMVEAMGKINTAAQDISKIIKVIDEIAFQTNLLALNAAVEAARAGQHGKGFSVVAEEVRSLAARSAKAARETAELIEGSVAMTEQGGQVADQTAEAFKDIVAGINEVSELVAGMAAASNEQAQGIAQINQGLGQIDQVTQQNTANAEQSAAAAEELSSQAHRMRSMLARFNLSREPGSSPAETGTFPPLPETQMLEPVAQPPSGGETLKWKESYNTGIQIVDRQHKRLLAMINELFQAMKSGGSREAVEETVNGLIEYTRSHFLTEENLMQEHGYPKFDEHKQVHDTFVAEVNGYRQKIQAGARLTAADVFNFLKGWLINHIEKADRDGYAPYLRERGVH